MCGPDSKLKEWPVLVEQKRQPFARRQTAQPALTLVTVRAAASSQSFFLLQQLVGKITQRFHGPSYDFKRHSIIFDRIG
jgi:hypothetical protein